MIAAEVSINLTVHRTPSPIAPILFRQLRPLPDALETGSPREARPHSPAVRQMAIGQSPWLRSGDMPPA